MAPYGSHCPFCGGKQVLHNLSDDDEAAIKCFNSIKSNSSYDDVKDPTGLTIRITDKTIKHILKDNGDKRRNYIGSIQESLNSPDEIWTTNIDNVIQRVYIKYFDNLPVVARVDIDNNLFTFHDILKNKKVNSDQARNLRKGILIYKKN